MDIPYVHTEVIHNFKAASEVMPVIIEKLKPKSILDVGCGTGTWLKVIKELGGVDIHGIDGAFVDEDLLNIAENEFTGLNLSSGFNLRRQFDLIICLEVAEHLPEMAAEKFVNSLCIHSNTILFSAAIPNQGGQNHLNEQWPSYWNKRFEKNRFKPFDVIRPLFWDNENVDFWYRQNMILYSNLEMEKIFNQDFGLNSIVHPKLLEIKVAEIENLKNKIRTNELSPKVSKSFRLLLRSLKQQIKK